MTRVIACLAVWAATAWAQQPVINPGGVVSAASYAAGISGLSRAGYPQTGGAPALAAGSLTSIFGSHLAATTLAAQTPLPVQLGGTSVSVNGIAAPLLFVSPTQINFQVPSSSDTTPGASSASGIVVSANAGQSAPYPLAAVVSAPGVFAADSSGCGQAAVLNVGPNGAVSLNSPTNGAVPGGFVSIYGTGNGPVSNPPTDGAPTPNSPLATGSGASPAFDFSAGGNEGPAFWEGRAPGLVGVDQFNFLVPTSVRQGCAVPLQIVNGNISAPVTISISNGGVCADPPVQGYGEITWEKTTTTGADSSVTATEAVTISLQASPGRQAPDKQVYNEQETLPGAYTYFGSQCPVPGYRSLGAGTITVQAPGMSPLAASLTPLVQGTVFNLLSNGGFTPVSQTQSGQVSGLSVYQAMLPSGTIRPGSFNITASGGTDVGAFQSSVQIGSPIQVTTPLAGVVLHSSGPAIPIQWTGGDQTAWVTVKLVGHFGGYDYYPYQWVARASDGQITLQGAGGSTGFGIVGPVDIVIEVVPDPSGITAFAAPNLSLGGQTFWKYTYRFEGALVEL